ncbi:efflux RND transporter periplasmic adaptor subunit [Sneathiella limimaris]|uniref:efflux RND transporter periplasmic adaptor subunit n=1 Tax=Sneathiella limimaris TaxID=1964213 RepID=UPI00146C8CFF|nr:HlyD family efflux transporter periplasmic adaptor subunit [Sneathiella limimaris]
MGRYFRMFWKALLPIAILALGVIGFSVLVKTKPEIATKEPEERSWNVAVQALEPAQVQSKIRVYGTVIAERDVDLRSLVGGEVVSVSERFKNGAFVQEGEVLIEVDPFDYELAVQEAKASLLEARARLSELEANLKSDRVLFQQDQELLDIEKRNLTRSLALKDRGNISDKALDDVKASLQRQRQQVETRSAGLEIEQARINQQKAAIERLELSLKKAERDRSNTSLLAPFSGYLQGVSVELGKKIDAKDQVATLIDAQNLEVQFQLSNDQYGSLLSTGEALQGRSIDVIWQVGRQKLTFTGKIMRFGSEIQAATGGIEIYAELAPSQNLNLIRSGAFVEVHMQGPKYEKAVRIPDYALFDKDKVYLVVDGRLRPVKVQILQVEGTDLIVSGEFSPDDQLLVTRFAEAGPGIKVEVR